MQNWEKQIISPQEFHDDILELIKKIPKNKYTHVYGVPRGGWPIAVYLSHYLNLKILSYLRFDDLSQNVLICDDLCDTGDTLEQFHTINDTATVYYKPRSVVKPTYYSKMFDNYQWIVFPYEKYDEVPNRKV